MSLSSLLIFAAALFVAAGSPGPRIAALVARVIAKGWRDVLPFLAAMWIGEAIWLSLAVFGLAFVAQTFHFAFVMLKWAGVAYLALPGLEDVDRAGRTCATATCRAIIRRPSSSLPAWLSRSAIRRS